MENAVSGGADLNVSKPTAYWYTFVLLTPIVSAFGIATFILLRGIQMPMPQFLALMGAAVLAGTWLSFMLTGVEVPVNTSNTFGGPIGAGQIVGRTFWAYLSAYGPLAFIGGVLEGAFFGYWAAVLQAKVT